MASLVLRCAALGLALPALAPTGAAQNGGNLVIRNNQPYLGLETGTCPRTRVSYLEAAASPPAYSAGAPGIPGPGVAPGTWSWRILPKETNYRAGVRLVTGFSHLQRTSACTTAGWRSDYIPRTALLGVVPRPAGQPGAAQGAVDPDWSRPLITIAELPTPALTTPFRVTRTFAPIAVASGGPGEQDVALAIQWRGGENRYSTLSHGYFTSWMAGDTPWNSWGFYDPAPPGTTTYSADPSLVLWLTYLEAEPTLSLHSSWGRRRIPQLSPPLLGHSLGTYYSDLAAQGGELGFSIRATGNPLGFGLMLFNTRPWAANRSTLFGQTLELDPADPALGALLAVPLFGVLPLGPLGETDSAPFRIPALPGLAGTQVGFEAFITDARLNITGSTGSAFVSL